MDYALALKLKEAGFPQEGDGKDLWDKMKTDLEFVYEPTLEEIMEELDMDSFKLKESLSNLYIKLHEKEN